MAGDVPRWVSKSSPFSVRQKRRRSQYARNVKVVRDARGPWDVVLWGDSITANVNASPEARRVFRKYFGRNAVALGVGGNTVEELAWRIVLGGEAPREAPGCVCVLAGVNNLNWSRRDPGPKMDWLLGWLRARYPRTRLVVMALLRNERTPAADLEAVNASYEAAAARHNAVFARCGDDLDSFVDDLHPDAAGYDLVFRRLRRVTPGVAT